MKIYFCHSRDFDFKNDLYKPIRESILNKQHEIILPHEDEFSTVKTKDAIKNCDIVFAEVSFPATGLGIELGWADTQAVPIVCVNKTGSKISSSLKFVADNFIEYSDTKDLVEKIEKFLVSFKRTSLADTNPCLDVSAPRLARRKIRKENSIS